MVTHTTIQKYKQNYFALCLTGLFGCKWHRYKQSRRYSKKADIAWFAVLLLSFLFITFWFYYWLITENDSNSFDWFLYSKTKVWIPWYLIIIILTSLSFGYLAFLMLLAMCHIVIGHQIYMHHCHRALVVTIVVVGVIVAIALGVMGKADFTRMMEVLTLDLSFQITGPWLHIGAVVLMTGMSWIVAEQWMYWNKTGLKIFWLLVYIVVMVGLYIVPVFIQSPCIGDSSTLPDKPMVMAHRGAAAISPENTLRAFRRSADFGVLGFESDVRVSRDGVPFLMHDKTLRRTTNVAEVFPDRKDELAENFTISELEQLNAGAWFMKQNPFHTVSSLSESTKELYTNQTIPTLLQLCTLARLLNKTVMFDLRVESEDHPYYNTSVNVTVDAIMKSKIQPSMVWWLSNTTNNTQYPADFTTVYPIKGKSPSVEHLQKEGIHRVNSQYVLTQEEISTYASHNISSNVYVVDSPWLFSLFWCMGTASVTTNMCHVFAQMDRPSWYISPQSYLIIWVLTDVISAILVITFFIIQRFRSRVRIFELQHAPT
ncbi:glycerophosphodiester phosphodiesterase domain-containing protein 5 isoform X2 [Lingula anatina]|uniref:Glycerophosphodiester phosphodiesterase domain-containing protein 5 isoform X2 n=1 Tax=Lingula anatina TaxID=7574 RepID=A0A1S3I2I1_LINAN|nr:glycerophosphodiester phosphodiesterase domain-containing protein 5 isoform X2 [Lingula anatina]|eukprot:XP_013392453.1 glycerophosphodiester phosphodiesterase domain-containing protein 5 isoform X2 [Lingula anatina]